MDKLKKFKLVEEGDNASLYFFMEKKEDYFKLVSTTEKERTLYEFLILYIEESRKKEIELKLKMNELRESIERKDNIWAALRYEVASVLSLYKKMIFIREEVEDFLHNNSVHCLLTKV